MKIFVSGGTGFIGSHAVKRLLKAGHKVRLLVHKKPLAKGKEEDEALETVQGDVTDLVSLSGLMDGCDAACNFVGIILEVGRATFERIHVEACKNLLEEAKRARVRRFLHISALGTSEEPVSRYFKTKWEAEQLIKKSGLPYVILRPSLVFGPEDKFFNMLKPFIKLPIMAVVGSGKTRFQPIWVEDVASCVLQGLEKEEVVNRVIQIAGPEVMTFDEILDIMSAVLKSRPLKVHIPVPLVQPGAWLMERLLTQPLVTTDQLKMLQVDNITDTTEMLKYFKVEHKSLREGLESYWLKGKKGE